MENQTQCLYCVMDKSAKEIVFDSSGRCNFCRDALIALKKTEEGGPCIAGILNEIKRAGQGKKYDVIIGLSGGIDSAAALMICLEEGLRPLCFSVDNGWNDPVADENIMKLVEGLKVPFFRYTIDKEKFSQLQSAFMNAGVINIEIPSDHVIITTAYNMAEEYDIKYIISGGNVATESIMPYSWSYHARDLRHIQAIYKSFTGYRLKGLPMMSLLKFNYFKWIKKIKVVNILDSYDYNRADSIRDLTRRFGYRDYGEKHEESVFTKWFQNFYLFEKFAIDKRKAHFSSLIVSGQMTRREAMDKLTASPIYPALGIEKRVLAYQKHEHNDFPTNEKLFNFISKIVKIFQ